MGDAAANGLNNSGLITPFEVQDYLDLDLSADGPVIAALRNRMIEEMTGASEAVALTGDLDSAPTGMTPEMTAWYEGYIAPRRHGAIDTIRGMINEERVDNAACTLLECEIDQLHHETAAAKHKQLDDFYRSQAEVRKKAEAAEEVYGAARAAQGGREPRMFNPKLYWFVLVLFLIPEFFLNFETFMAVWFIQSPFLATGATFLVAAAITFASHLHGSLLRQRDYYFGPYDTNRRAQGLQILWIGNSLFGVAMGAVLGARYFYLQPEIQQAILLGIQPPSLIGSLAFMVAGNLIVYLLGCGWAFITHDDDPDYPSIKRKADELRDQYDAAFRTMVVDELNRLDQKAAKEEARLKQREARLSASPGYQRCRRLFAMVKGKDAEVVAALKDYRAVLTRKGSKTRYLYPDRSIIAQDRMTELSAGQWAAKDLTLKYHMNRAG